MSSPGDPPSSSSSSSLSPMAIAGIAFGFPMAIAFTAAITCKLLERSMRPKKVTTTADEEQPVSTLEPLQMTVPDFEVNNKIDAKIIGETIYRDQFMRHELESKEQGGNDVGGQKFKDTGSCGIHGGKYLSKALPRIVENVWHPDLSPPELNGSRKLGMEVPRHRYELDGQ